VSRKKQRAVSSHPGHARLQKTRRETQMAPGTKLRAKQRVQQINKILSSMCACGHDPGRGACASPPNGDQPLPKQDVGEAERQMPTRHASTHPHTKKTNFPSHSLDSEEASRWEIEVPGTKRSTPIKMQCFRWGAAKPQQKHR
jgi:hypothetical protein